MSAGGNKWARARADLLPLAGLAAMIFAPFIVRAVMGRSALSPPLMHDVGFQWVPFRAFIARALGEGMFPLWAPEVFAGFPFAAFSHTGVFYPLGWLLLLTDYARAVNFFYPLHLTIAAAGVYALGRSIGLSRLAAWLAAMSYVFTGKPYYFIHFLPAACSNAWAPWLLAGAVGLLRGGGSVYFALVAASLGLELTGGDVESTSYALLFSALFLALMAGPLGLRARRAPLLAAALLVGALLAAVQVLPLAEYSRHFVRNHGVTFAYFSSRELPAAMIWAALLPLGSGRAGAVLDAPYFYLGALTIGLALTAGVRRLGAGSGRMLVLALMAALWSFGSVPAMDHLQYALPVLRSFGSPEQAYFIAQLFVVLLAGRALDAAAAGPSRRTMLVGAAALAFGALRSGAGLAGVKLLPAPWSLLMIALALMAYGLWRCGRGSARGPRTLVIALAVFQVVDLYALAFIYLPSTRPEAVAYPEWLRRLAPKLSPARGRTIMVSREGLTDPDLLYHAGLALGFDTIDSWITVPPRDYAKFMALVDPRAARFVDGKLDHMGLNAELRDGRFIDAGSMPLLDLLALRVIIDRGLPLKFGSPSVLFLSPPEFRKRSLRPGLPSIFAPEGNDGSLPSGFSPAPPHDESIYRVFVTAGDRLRLARPRLVGRSSPAACRLFVEAVAGNTTEPLAGMVITSTPEPEASAVPELIDLDRFAGREIGLRFALDCPDALADLAIAWPSPVIVNPNKPLQAVEVESGRPDLLVYQNREALPRVWVAHQVTAADGNTEELAQIRHASRAELLHQIWLRGDMLPYFEEVDEDDADRESARLVSRRPGEEVYEVESRGAGLLFIADQYYPGWRAEVRGHEAAILRADHCFRAVPVPEGKSTVRLTFVPASFRVGLWLSLVSLLAGAGMLARMIHKCTPRQNL